MNRVLLLFIGCFWGCDDDSLDLHNDIIAVPFTKVSQACKPDPNSPVIVYLNFNGQKITKSPYSNATTNKSFIGGGTIPPFAIGKQTLVMLVNVVKNHFGPFNIRIVTTRPLSGDYHMAVIGGTPSDLKVTGSIASAVGLAPLDCGNTNPRDIVFVFGGTISKKYPPSSLVYLTSAVIAHELGHAFGLPHVTGTCDLMFPMGSGGCATGMKTFIDQPISITAGYTCGKSTINTYQHLLKVIGANTKDTSPPLVRILSPIDTSSVDTALKVDAKISDDKKVVKVALLVDEKVKATHQSNLATFSLKLAEGQHVLKVEAWDAAGNKGFDQVRVKAVALKAPDAMPPPIDDMGMSDQQTQTYSDQGNMMVDRGGCSIAKEDQLAGRVQSALATLALVLILSWIRRLHRAERQFYADWRHRRGPDTQERA